MPARAVRHFALVITTVALTACLDTTAPLPDSGVPAALELSIGGFGGHSSALALRGDTIVMYRVPWDYVPGRVIDTVRVVPTAEAWRAFWAAANTAGVNRWHSEYRADEIMDGLGWNLRLATGNREITSWGSNAYPDNSGAAHKGEMTTEFRAFLTALDQLVGQSFY
ncbi:MAG: hypothetical protein ABIY52_18775 [Gemmatimonadaceae bacterium]